MITILGATGNVGRKIADILIKRGDRVVLVARSADRLRPLVGKRSMAMAGDALDTEFLVKAFEGSDGVFTLLPPNLKAEDSLEYADRIGKSIARAVEIAKVRYVVNLSSIGAELAAGTGQIVGLHRQEERLNRIAGLNVLHLRAGYFMENLLLNIDLIKSKGINGGLIRGGLRIPLTTTKDIASFAAERLAKRDFSGSAPRYLLGKRDLSLDEATMSIGIRIGKPNLRYVTFPYQDAQKVFVAAGLSPDSAKLMIEMSKAFNDGLITARRTGQNTTDTSFEEFCDRVFVPLYMERKAA